MGHPAAPRRILVVEDEPLYREMLSSTLDTAGFESIPAATATDAVKLFRLNDPDAALIDINLGGGPNGLHLAARLRVDSPALPIIFLTVHSDPRSVAGPPIPDDARFVVKSRVQDVADLLAIVEESLRGASPVTRHDRVDDNVLGSLTTAQMEVLHMIADGLTNKQIAEHRGTSLRAVEQLVQKTLVRVGLGEMAGNRRVLASRILNR